MIRFGYKEKYIFSLVISTISKRISTVESKLNLISNIIKVRGLSTHIRSPSSTRFGPTPPPLRVEKINQGHRKEKMSKIRKISEKAPKICIKYWFIALKWLFYYKWWVFDNTMILRFIYNLKFIIDDISLKLLIFDL